MSTLVMLIVADVEPPSGTDVLNPTDLGMYEFCFAVCQCYRFLPH